MNVGMSVSPPLPEIGSEWWWHDKKVVVRVYEVKQGRFGWRISIVFGDWESRKVREYSLAEWPSLFSCLDDE